LLGACWGSPGRIRIPHLKSTFLIEKVLPVVIPEQEHQPAGHHCCVDAIHIEGFIGFYPSPFREIAKALLVARTLSSKASGPSVSCSRQSAHEKFSSSHLTLKVNIVSAIAMVAYC
jgi:hypothetical protein